MSSRPAPWNHAPSRRDERCEFYAIREVRRDSLDAQKRKELGLSEPPLLHLELRRCHDLGAIPRQRTRGSRDLQLRLIRSQSLRAHSEQEARVRLCEKSTGRTSQWHSRSGVQVVQGSGLESSRCTFSSLLLRR